MWNDDRPRGEADEEAAADLFTEDASYRSNIFTEPHIGRSAIRSYWEQATATQREIRVLMGQPIVDEQRVAVEWWTTMKSDGEEVTLPGCLLLDFDDQGKCRSLHEYYQWADGLLDPPEGWGGHSWPR